MCITVGEYVDFYIICEGDVFRIIVLRVGYVVWRSRVVG